MITSGLKTNFNLPPSFHSTSLIQQVPFSQTTTKIMSTISECKPTHTQKQQQQKTITHVLELIYILRALNVGNLHQLSVPMSRVI